MFDLSGRVALVTGASSGIGLASARALGQQGAKVYLNGRNAERLEAAAADLGRQGLQVVALPFDVSDIEASCHSVDQILQREGRLDICFANAGIQHRATLEEFPLADFERVLHVNLSAQWALGRHVAHAMKQQGHGRLIYTGSITALLGKQGVSAYSLSKGALHTMVKQWAAELGSGGVTVNAVAPGYVRTELTRALHEDSSFETWLQQRCPLQRWGAPEDIAPAIVFLASDEARFVTGHVLVVDGGLSAVM
ncbi:MAG TPA: glucose 1-dehydrogenase [Burkholderiaceae bacterium]|nr:glucose 1-dehydrogenase [Burkholderiaceae bacterium]